MEKKVSVASHILGNDMQQVIRQHRLKDLFWILIG